jgi:CheY-like chemotaxis protein
VGEGTTVSLYFPRGRGKIAPVAVPAAIAHRPPERLPVRAPAPVDPRGEPVLVVEDDPRVRVATIAAIEELGYRPIGCASGEEALDLLDTQREIRLMITDVVMPGMTGPELGAAVRKRHPHIAILFVTGYAGEAGESDLAGQAVLRKPFTVAALERAVSDALLSAPHLPRGAAAAE